MEISIITVNYNNLSGLKSTIQSVVNQTCDVEFIIIDGGSTDGSLDLIQRFDSAITYWVSEPDEGIYDAMNKGIREATGSYLMFLNSGDELLDADTLKKCVGFIESEHAADILYGDILLVKSAVEQQNNTIKKMPASLDVTYFKDNTLNHQASLFKKALFDEFGLYPNMYVMAADYWLYLISLKHEKIFSYMNFPLVKYDLSGVSATSFSRYQSDMRAVWENVLPKMVRDISRQNDALVVENNYLKTLTRYRLVQVAIHLNALYQKMKPGS